MVTKVKESVDIETLHALMGHYARQHADVQKLRIQVGNRHDAMVRDEIADQWTLPMRAQRDGLEGLESAIEKQLERLAKQHPMSPWIATEAKGMSHRTFALLFGITGPLDRFATVSKLWHYLGMHVDQGEAPRKRRGEKLSYSPQGRTRCYLIGEAIVKVGGGGKYRALYDAKKAYYEAERVDWPQIRRHRAAMRYAVKAMLKDMWVEWRRVLGEEA